jgi:hypothetical protein
MRDFFTDPGILVDNSKSPEGRNGNRVGGLIGTQDIVLGTT